VDWKQYQELAMRTRGIASELSDRLVMGALGLSGEAGEVTDHIKKIVFQGHDIDRQAMTEELGDVLWYVASLLDALDLDMSDVLEANIAKLRARYPEGFSGERSRNRATDTA
jgi:NTP pyrophosphatase (non-canonical NTP hydrolase)